MTKLGAILIFGIFSSRSLNAYAQAADRDQSRLEQASEIEEWGQQSASPNKKLSRSSVPSPGDDSSLEVKATTEAQEETHEVLMHSPKPPIARTLTPRAKSSGTISPSTSQEAEQSPVGQASRVPTPTEQETDAAKPANSPAPAASSAVVAPSAAAVPLQSKTSTAKPTIAPATQTSSGVAPGPGSATAIPGASPSVPQGSAPAMPQAVKRSPATAMPTSTTKAVAKPPSAAPEEAAAPAATGVQPAAEKLQGETSKSTSASSTVNDWTPALSDDLKKSPKAKISHADIGLSSVQTNAIIEIRKKAQNELEKRLTDELKVAKAAMNAAMVDATPAEEVRKKFEFVQKTYLELQRIKFEKTLKIREVLTVEQRKKLQSLKSSH